MKRKILLLSPFLATALIIINNCQLTPAADMGAPELLAHRGLAQTFDISKVTWDTNTAGIIYPPEHSFIENSIPSMEAAFNYGADIVEFDIRVTKDKKLVVFHDYLLDSRTDGKGPVSEYTLEELKQLDIGFGYTADGGKTFPLRKTGIGLMPSFDEVLQRFPDKKFLIHLRDEGEEIGHILLGKLKTLNEERIDTISLYGNDPAIALIRDQYPTMKALTARMMKKGVLSYALLGWTGFIPGSIKNMELHMPIEYAKFLWGWPHIFLKRMQRANTRLVLVQKRGPWSGGFDTEEDLKRIPEHYSGCIWTDRIDRIGNLFE